MIKKKPSSEAVLKAGGRSSSEALLKAESRSSSETLLKRSAPQGRRPLLEAEGQSSSEALREAEGRSSLFFKVTIDLLQSGQSVRFQAPGRSMTPTIREYETITVEPISPSSVRKGDIILYNNESGVIAHRVVRIEKEDSLTPASFILRGDASLEDDKPVSAEQVLGKVVSLERNGRSVALCGNWAKTKRIARLVASRAKRLLKPLLSASGGNLH